MIKRQTGLFVFAITAILVFAASALAQKPIPTPVDDDPPETVFVEEIKLNVSAFDRFGEFVPKVEKEDLVVIEDGRLHQPDSIRRIPASVLIVLDTGGEMRRVKTLNQTRMVAIKLVSSLTEEDSIAILEYADKPRILKEWTSDKTQVRQALENQLGFGVRSLFVDALKLATEFLQKSDNENRHLVLITDGTDSLDRTGQREEEMRRLMTTNINVHVLSYTGLEASAIVAKTKTAGVPAHPNPLPSEVIEGLPEALRTVNKAPKFGAINTDKKFLRVMKKREQDLVEGGKFLLELSENTSGMYILPDSTDEMIDKARLIANIIDSNYVVTYTPSRPLRESRDGEIRTVEVSSRRTGLNVAARRKIIVRNEPK